MSQVKGNGATQPYPSAQDQTGHYGAVQHGAIENRALHKLAEPGFTPHTFFSYLIVQAMVLLAWWPKGGLFDRIDAAAEPVTLTAVAIYTGAALAYFALQLSADELSHSQTTVSNQASTAANARWSILQSTRLSPLSVVSKYLKAHAIQLLYLLALCTPLMAVAHALSSVPITALLWIALVTTVHTTFYRLLGSWLHLRWTKHDMLATVVSRALLAIVYLATVFLLPELSHISISFQLTQPSMISMSAPASTLEIVLIFLVTYSALCIVLCIALYMAVSAAQSHTTGREAKH
jgi:hypothetical protein